MSEPFKHPKIPQLPENPLKQQELDWLANLPKLLPDSYLRMYFADESVQGAFRWAITNDLAAPDLYNITKQLLATRAEISELEKKRLVLQDKIREAEDKLAQTRERWRELKSDVEFFARTIANTRFPAAA
jgi:septal ring factor EnvC (AmiA/AmiB activator)